MRMTAAPTRTVAVATEVVGAVRGELPEELVEALWEEAEAAACGLERGEFEQVLVAIARKRGFFLEGDAPRGAGAAQTWFAGLPLADLVLARACAAGKEPAWERFIALYRAALLRAGIAITGSETLGRELADGLYAELYGLTERGGERRCLLDSYSGRGTLLGWLRTVLAQRHVDHHRRTRREEPLEASEPVDAQVWEPIAEAKAQDLAWIREALREGLAAQGEEERFVLASYYLDGRTLHQIAAVLGVHEATVCRKLKRTTEAVRKQVMKNLQRRGWSRRQAEEAMATDPRDLSGDDEPGRARWKELLQGSEGGTFQTQAGGSASTRAGPDLPDLQGQVDQEQARR